MPILSEVGVCQHGWLTIELRGTTRVKKLILTWTAATLLAPQFVHAEWSQEPQKPLQLAVGGDAAKLFVDGQGNVLVATNDLFNTNDLYLQKLNRQGQPLWDNQPVKVLDLYQTFTTVRDYAFGTDNSFYIATWRADDSRYYTPEISGDEINDVFITKTNADGSAGWPMPFQVTPTSVPLLSNLSNIKDAKVYKNLMNSQIVMTDNGLAYTSVLSRTTYTYSNRLFSSVQNLLQLGMLGLDGQKKWDVLITPNHSSAQVVDVQAVNDGIVLLYIDNKPAGAGTGRSFFLRKYSLTGQQLWAAPVQVHTDSTSLNNANDVFTRLYPDGAGGVVFAWKRDNGPSFDMLFQRVDSNGKKLYDRAGIRISSGFDSKWDQLAQPFINVSEHGYMVVWSAQGPDAAYKNYGIHAQLIKPNGELAFGGEPLVVKALISSDNTKVDVGVLESGEVAYHNNQYSISYYQATNYTENNQSMYRLDMDVQGNVLRDQVTLDLQQRIIVKGSAASPFGETVTVGALAGLGDAPKDVFVSSHNRQGLVGITSELALSYPQTALVQQEDQTLTSVLTFVDSAAPQGRAPTDYLLTTSSSSDQVHVSAKHLDNGRIELSATPAPNFAGEVTAAVQLSDAAAPSRMIEVKYPMVFDGLYDEPNLTLGSATLNVNEDETVNVTPTIDNPDHADLSMTWTQTGGPAVEFAAKSTSLSFKSPLVKAATELSFVAKLSDGTTTKEQSLSITVNNDKKLSIVAGQFNVKEGGSLRIKPVLQRAQPIVTSQWTQLSGPRLTISAPTNLETDITAPYLNANDTATLQLTVTDAFGDTATQQFTVAIEQPVVTKSGGAFEFWPLLGILGIALRRRRTTALKVLE